MRIPSKTYFKKTAILKALGRIGWQNKEVEITFTIE
jgi:hypothetical protein